MSRQVPDLDPRPRWGIRDSGLLVPEDLVHYEPPPPPRVEWVHFEAHNLFRLPHWARPDRPPHVIVRNS